ncbi:3-phenylpropionate-dihydrodiol/cinnamic acid-dihydrodiol dehydrogenase [Streptosporangium roseum]|uniref:Dehydrogenase with different specificities (Related to short-chain alcohol dehydrogenase)-like protein n=2 Tax=Streptosporangium roseum TaxID=2001 RepID=D2BBL8_STRRD|nr:Dehydrogenase with different specificities (related to short-chain alcohol dehydrogenase)-like protein [Streptosporangium roseum DSM 43021]
MAGRIDRDGPAAATGHPRASHRTAGSSWSGRRPRAARVIFLAGAGERGNAGALRGWATMCVGVGQDAPGWRPGAGPSASVTRKQEQNMSRFTGKVAVVTGAAQGIGAAIAARLAEEGAAVAVVDLTAERAQATVDAITAKGGLARAYGCDVAVKPEVEAVFERVAAELNGLHILVNNAGITRDNLFFKMSAEDWSSVLTVNLTSAFNCSQAAQKVMVAQRYGKIVSLSSRSALGNRGQANYAAAKAGIQGLTATLAIELGPYNINVNAVAPGYIATPMTAATAERVGSSAEEHQKAAAERTPLRRVGTPEEVASVVAFLASEDASYVSGQTIYINGGAR